MHTDIQKGYKQFKYMVPIYQKLQKITEEFISQEIERLVGQGVLEFDFEKLLAEVEHNLKKRRINERTFLDERSSSSSEDYNIEELINK